MATRTHTKIVRHVQPPTFELITEETTTFELSAHEVLISISACGLANPPPIDVLRKVCGEAERFPVGGEVSGTVELIGADVSFVMVGDEVCGLLPLNSSYSGCADRCVICEFDLVKKPPTVRHVDAASVLADGVTAYTALYYQVRLKAGESVLICGAASSLGLLLLQLAQSFGAFVYAAASTDEEMSFLQSIHPPVNAVIDVRNKKRDLVSICMEETGGLGVDCVIDNGVRLSIDAYDKQDTSFEINATKLNILSCLAVGGRWVTFQPNLRLDPNESELLFFKCASLHFSFSAVWQLSRSAQGRFLHILRDVVDKLSNGVLRPTIHHTLRLEDVVDALDSIHEHKIGKIVVTMGD